MNLANGSLGGADAAVVDAGAAAVAAGEPAAAVAAAVVAAAGSGVVAASAKAHTTFKNLVDIKKPQPALRSWPGLYCASVPTERGQLVFAPMLGASQ